MEIAIGRLDGVEKVSISIPDQVFEVTYKPGAIFRPADLRAAAGQANVTVLQFHVRAQGQVQQEAGKRFFLAGKDKFLLVDADKLPLGVPLSIVGSVNDASKPNELKVTEFKPLPKGPPR